MPGRSSESQLVELGMFVTTTVFGTVVLVALAVFFGISAIENYLETTAEDGLFAAGVTDVAVEASGTDVLLRGTVSNEDQLVTVPQFVEQIEGVGTVTPDLAVVSLVEIDAPEIVAAPITINWTDGSADIVGEVSDESTRVALVAALEDFFPKGVAAESLTIKDGARSERDWLSKILTLIQIGGESLDEGKLFINAPQRLVQMTGEYETRQERRDARDAIDEVIAETTFAFVSGLSIPPAPEYTAEQVEELQENLDDLIEGKVVEFELNSDILTPVGAALLDEIIDALEKFPAVPIEIAGHTDSQGDEAENLELSERRARTALDYLVGNGLDPERFVVAGYGEDVPIASNSTADGRARNRRIEFKALGE